MDERFAQFGAEDQYEHLLDAGVRVWIYQRTMLHVKMITVDGCLACIGSPNFNHRSMRKDDEVLMLAIDRALVAALDRDFDDDVESSALLKPGEWKRRSFLQRQMERVAALFRTEM